MDFLLVVLVTTCFDSVVPAIVITRGPQNITVYEGQSASFPCSYTGINEYPIWFINDSSYTIQGMWLGLPERHTFFNQTMFVRDVEASDNGTTYRCSFSNEATSQTATLTVIPAPPDNVRETTDLQLLISTVTSTGIAPSAAAVIIICVLVSILTTWLCHKRGCFAKCSRPKSDLEDPTYEDVPNVLLNTVELKMDPNVCYSGRPCTSFQPQDPEYAEIESIVKTSSNSAYAL